MAIYIVRHGETDYNKQGKYLGRTDLPLNSAGIYQAKELVTEVNNLPIDVVISSPLKRTMETSRIIAFDKEIIKDEDYLFIIFTERSKF